MKKKTDQIVTSAQIVTSVRLPVELHEAARKLVFERKYRSLNQSLVEGLRLIIEKEEKNETDR